MLTKIMPELPFDDVTAAVNYYKNVLGFSINYQQVDIGVMDRDAVRVLLVARTDRHTGIGSTYVYVDDADALYRMSREGRRDHGRAREPRMGPTRFSRGRPGGKHDHVWPTTVVNAGAVTVPRDRDQ